LRKRLKAFKGAVRTVPRVEMGKAAEPGKGEMLPCLLEVLAVFIELS
jgi:hypothetical protein